MAIPTLNIDIKFQHESVHPSSPRADSPQAIAFGQLARCARNGSSGGKQSESAGGCRAPYPL